MLLWNDNTLLKNSFHSVHCRPLFWLLVLLSTYKHRVLQCMVGMSFYCKCAIIYLLSLCFAFYHIYLPHLCFYDRIPFGNYCFCFSSGLMSVLRFGKNTILCYSHKYDKHDVMMFIFSFVSSQVYLSSTLFPLL